MYCPGCGNRITEGSKFCGKCGMRLDTVAAAHDQHKSGGNVKKHIPLSIILAGVIAVIVIALAAVLFLGFLREHSPEESGSSAGEGLFTSEHGADTPVYAETYLVVGSGEEELYYTESYYEDGTLAETWIDSSVGLDIYEYNTARITYTEDGNLLKSESSYQYKDTVDDSEQKHEISITCSYKYNAQGNPISCSLEHVSDGDISYIDMEIAYDDEDMIRSLHVQKAEEASGTEAAFLVFAYSENGSLTSIAIADGDYGSPDEVEGYDLVLSYSYDEDWNLTEISSGEDYGGNLDSSMIQYALLALGDTRGHRQVFSKFAVFGYSRITIEYDESGNQTQIYVLDTNGKESTATFYNYGSEKNILQTEAAVEETKDSRDRVIKRISWYDADSWEDADRYTVTYLEYE